VEYEHYICITILLACLESSIREELDGEPTGRLFPDVHVKEDARSPGRSHGTCSPAYAMGDTRCS